MSAAAPVDQRVVDHIGIRGQEVGVERFARQQRADDVAADGVQEGGRIRAFHLVDAHVGNVEQTGGLAGGQVLFHHRGVPDRHFPAGEGDHLGAQGFVDFVQRRPAQGRFGFLPFEGGQGLAVPFAGDADEPGFLRTRLSVGDPLVSDYRCGDSTTTIGPGRRRGE